MIDNYGIILLGGFMNYFNINDKLYKISDNYNFSRSAWVEPLDKDTKLLILDYTIMWNMVEHQVYGDTFNKNGKTEKCIENVVNAENANEKVDYVYNLFKEYISKYQSVEEFYEGFMFEKSGINITLIKKLIDSNELKDKLKLLIYSCYRVRCNLFHGPKCIVYLDDQKLLFLSMNELLSFILKAYGM